MQYLPDLSPCEWGAMADVKVKPKSQKAGMALAVLALSLGFTLLVWMLASASQHSKAQARFTDEAVDLREVIRDRLLIFESTLFGVQGLFEASDTVTRSDFKQYISGHDGSRLQPGFQAIGFIQHVPAASAAALVESIRADGLPQFSIIDPTPDKDMHVIVYVEPFEGRNLRVLGRNLANDVPRLAAMERSRDTNAVAVTSRMHLMQEPAGSNAYGFVMYVPVYNNKMPSATVEQRRAAYIGSVYAAFRLPDLIEQAVGRKGNLVDLEVFDAPTADPAHLFYERKARTAESADASGLDPLTYSIHVGGRAWTLRFSPSPKLVAQLGNGFSNAILASGIIISLLVFFIALSIDRNRNKAMAMAEDITRKLNDALSFQRVVLDGAAYSIIATEVDGTIRLMNIAAEKMLGYRAHELVGKVTPAHFHDPNEMVERAKQLSAETGQSVKPDFATFVARAKDGIQDDGEWTFIRKDGTRLKVHLSVTRLMSAAGKLSGYLGVAYDLTDRKRAEEALRRSEQELLLTLDAAEIGTWDWDMTIQRIRWGGSHATILGLTDAAQTPTTYNDFLAVILPDDSVVIERGVKQALDTRQMTTMEFRIRRRDSGEIRWLSLRGRVYFDDKSGIALRMVGIVRDVTKRRVAEETLREKTLALEHAVEGIAKLDTEGRIIEINRAYEVVAGYEPNELVGDKWSTLVNPVEWPQVQQSIETMWSAGKSEIECCGLRKDGFPFYMQCVLTHTVNGPGRGNGYYCFMKDITERKRAEEAVRAAREETEAANTHLAVVNQQLEDAIGKANEMAIRAEQANQAKSEFLATMSHEIRTPMNGIIGFTNLLCETDLNSEQHEFAETIRNSGQALLSLINDILDFSKIEAGKLSVEIMPFDLRQAVEESAELLSSTAEARGLQILLRVAPDCPCNLSGDPTRVRQVLLNLVGNAVKFTHEGHVLIDVRQEPSADGAQRFVRCSVSDTGIGIPDSKQRQLFQPFSQADASTTRQYGGTGLGLAICKRLIELLGGKIGLHSTPEKGSTFWFTLPLAADAVRVQSNPVPEFSGRRALILHNYPLSRELIGDALRFWNMQVETASTFEGASMCLRECIQAPARAFDVVLAPLDLLQESNGMLSNVLSQAPFKGRTSVVAIARGNQRSDIRKLMGQTIHGSILTPIVRMEALATALRSVLRPDVIPASQSRASKPREALPATTVASAPSRYRVLLADDNVVNQKLAVKMLEKLGCVVDVACNGSEAVTLSQQLPYDIVFMDCHMPEMDGFEATAEIRRLSGTGRRVPIVAVTADALQGDRERCLEAGMDGYISKPIKRDDLSKAIEAFCGQQVGT